MMLNYFDFNRLSNDDKLVCIAHLKLQHVVNKDLGTISV